MDTSEFARPVIIVGAPRSGTSMLQKIIREHPCFVSVAKESGLIWRKYVHPSLNGWQGEMFDTSRFTPEMSAEIRAMFTKYALPAGLWNRFGRLNIMKYQRNPALAPFFRAGYTVLASILNILPERSADHRLVDKSVHSGLWLNLVDSVFPDALYIHIKRDGNRSVDSMIDGWLNPNRFFTYDLPVKLEIPDYPFSRWNFALPRNWGEYTCRPLEEVVAFQWNSIQRSIMQSFASDRFSGRTLSIKMEDLVGDTEQTLKRVTSFIGLDWDEYFAKLAEGLPVVNSGPRDKPHTRWHNRNPGYRDKVRMLINETMQSMDYV